MNDDSVCILVVDDMPENLLVLDGLLGDLGVRIFQASSGGEALSLSLKEDFAVVLLDVMMPEMDGFETATLMRSAEKTKNVPIIFITALGKERKYVFQGYESGAVDYLLKPLDPDILRSKVKVFVELDQQRRSLRKMAEDLERTVEELEEANRTIQTQQAKIVEEERLKVLLQMAGATAHELNQPLTILLGRLAMMSRSKGDAEKMAHHAERVEESGRRIAEIVEKIQRIRHDSTKQYASDSSIIDIDQGNDGETGDDTGKA